MSKRKDEIVETLKSNGMPEEFIENIINCKQWEQGGKENFVAWCCDKISYLSSHPCLDKEGKTALEFAKLQYELYLICLNEK